jgi:hypothetical protein
MHFDTQLIEVRIGVKNKTPSNSNHLKYCIAQNPNGVCEFLELSLRTALIPVVPFDTNRAL